MSKDLKEALNTYYSLKNQYEKNFLKEKNKIINVSQLSWREKRIEFHKLKRKCINCKRPVGSIFKNRVSKDGERNLIALCGDRSDPCRLDININVGYVVNIFDFIKKDEKDIEKYKKDIIKEKNDLLFGYIDSETAVKRFDDIKDNISVLMSSYEFTLDIYLNIIDNKEKKGELKKKQEFLFVEIDSFKKLIEQYEKTQDIQFISDAIELCSQSILPTAQEIRNLKYAYSGVEYNENDNTYSLIQKPVTMEQLEWDLGEKEQGVISMKMGIDKTRIRNKPEIKNVSAIQPLKLMKISSDVKQMLQEKNENEEKSESDESESDESESDESESESDEDSEEEEKPKITIQPQLEEDGKIAASEVNRLKWTINMVNGKLMTKNPTSGQMYEIIAGI